MWINPIDSVYGKSLIDHSEFERSKNCASRIKRGRAILHLFICCFWDQDLHSGERIRLFVTTPDIQKNAQNPTNS